MNEATVIEPSLVDIEGARQILSVSPATIRRLTARGLLRKIPVGTRAIRYSVEELRRFGQPVEDLSSLN